jgi:hypothetical protein
MKETASMTAKITSSRLANEKLIITPSLLMQNTCSQCIRTFLKISQKNNFPVNIALFPKSWLSLRKLLVQLAPLHALILHFLKHVRF